MTPEEAQELSVSGVAVLGNPAMQDIIWPKDSPHPFWFITNGYKAIEDPEKIEAFRKRDWRPLHMKYRLTTLKEKAALYGDCSDGEIGRPGREPDCNWPWEMP